MFANERRMKILEVLERQSSVTVAELMQRFEVSIETVRRDLEYLESKQALRRVHGGAVSNQRMNSFTKLENRLSENKALKQQLARNAAGLVQENDTIAIDSGSTAMELVPFLKERFHRLTVVTNSPDVFGALSEKDGFELIQIGGQYLREEKAFYGHLAVDAIRRLHVKKAFLFPSAVSLQYGIGVFVHELFDIQRAFLTNCDEAFILADSSKFEKTAAIKLCDVSPSYTIVTDSQLPAPVLAQYKKKGIPILHNEV